MYGTRKEVTHELKRVFEAGEPLALLVWTTESVKAMAQSHGMTDSEAESVLAHIGTLPMQEYQQKGVSSNTVLACLSEIRAQNRTVVVPADVLSRVVLIAEQALELEKWTAKNDRTPIPNFVYCGFDDVAQIRNVLNA